MYAHSKESNEVGVGAEGAPPRGGGAGTERFQKVRVSRDGSWRANPTRVR